MFGLIILGNIAPPPKPKKSQGKADPAAADKAIPGVDSSRKQAWS